jgi:hypothetical protein
MSFCFWCTIIVATIVLISEISDYSLFPAATPRKPQNADWDEKEGLPLEDDQARSDH